MYRYNIYIKVFNIYNFYFILYIIFNFKDEKRFFIRNIL